MAQRVGHRHEIVVGGTQVGRLAQGIGVTGGLALGVEGDGGLVPLRVGKCLAGEAGVGFGPGMAVRIGGALGLNSGS